MSPHQTTRRLLGCLAGIQLLPSAPLPSSGTLPVTISWYDAMIPCSRQSP